METNNRGFTLTEVIVVMAIIGILVAFAAPTVYQYLTNARYREANQRIHSLLLDARQRAVSLNSPVTVQLVLDAGASNSNNTYVSIYTKFDGTTETVAAGKFPDGVEIRGNVDCSVTTGTVSVSFNPDGSSSQSYFCVLDGTTNKYQTGVNNTSTGRVVSKLWRGGGWH